MPRIVKERSCDAVRQSRGLSCRVSKCTREVILGKTISKIVLPSYIYKKRKYGKTIAKIVLPHI